MSVIFTETVRRYYTEHLPLAMRALGTPEEAEVFFRQRGAQIEDQVQHSEDRIAGPDPVGETYLQKVGRLRMARAQAQEIALADLLYSTPPEDDDEETTPRGQQLLQLGRQLAEEMTQLNAQLDRELDEEMTTHR